MVLTAAEAGPVVGLAASRLPREATIRRTLHALDATALAAFTQSLPGPPSTPAPEAPAGTGLALDGKAACGANRHGAQVYLLSLPRRRGWTTIADALRLYAASPLHAIALIIAPARDVDAALLHRRSHRRPDQQAQARRMPNVSHWVSVENFESMPAAEANSGTHPRSR